MIETSIPEINVDELMEKIRAEVRQRRERGGTLHRTVPRANDAPLSNSCTKVDLSKICSMAEPGPFEFKEQGYHINDFLKYHDQHFVMNAYRGILRRGPDSEAFQYFLKNLRSGEMTKAEVLGRLRYAPEGRANKVKISGLFWNFLTQSSFRIPVLGYFFRLAVGIANFPVIVRNLQVLEGSTFTQSQQQRNDLNNALGQLGSILDGKADREELGGLKGELEVVLGGKADRDELGGLKGELEVVLGGKADKVELAELGDGKADREEVGVLKGELEVVLDGKADNEQIKSIDNQIREILRQTRDHKLNIIDQQRRLKLLLEEARKRLPEPLSSGQMKKMVKEEDHLLDAAYVSFEDQFRGTREDIKERLKIYLPYIRKSRAGEKESLLLDVGCGRGEWLELLKEEGMEARGIDFNRILIDECLERGFEVLEAEAIRYLREVSDRSLGAVTGFHIIEHLPLKVQIKLMDETVRVLKPGGMAIFETPNPQNLLVGACDFYKDPSHVRPLHPDAQRFLMEYQGFSRVKIIYLNPPDEYRRLSEDEAPQLAGRLNGLLSCARDYAVLGYKA